MGLDASSLLDSPGQTVPQEPEPSPSLDGTEGWLETISTQLADWRLLMQFSVGVLIFLAAAILGRTKAA